MRRLRWLFTIALVLSGAVAIPMARSGAVVFGSTVDAKTVPFTVAILFRDRPNAFWGQFCDGEYVDSYWVLTAAHCVVGRGPHSIQVASGITNRTDITMADRRDIAQIVVDPNYDSIKATNDVALLRLVQPAPASSVIPMNVDPTFPALGAPLHVYGWGYVNGATDLAYTNSLQGGAVTDFAGPRGSCGRWPTYDPNYNLCAAGRIPNSPHIVDSCNGDSGGPLVADTPGGPRLVGTVDYGDFLCGNSYVDPGVYARVSTLASWISYVVTTTPHLSIANNTIVEGNPYYGNKTMHLTVTLDHAVPAAVQVDFKTVDSSAKAGSDYKATAGTLTIPANSLTGTVNVVIISDKVKEPTEGFFVVLSNPRVAKLARGVAIGWILDND